MVRANLKRTAVRGIGEIALRVNDLDAMQRFYEQVIGLPLMTRFPNSAFEIPLADFEREKKRLEGLGLQVETAEHAWVHWRSRYVTDPEGNQVELVCHDNNV